MRVMRQTASMTSSLRASIAWIPSASSFGARLALVRQRMGWGNVKEAAIACGVPPESWRSWERDGATPRRIVDIGRSIADRTGVDYFWLLTGETPADDSGPRPDGPDGGQKCAIRDSNPEPADLRLISHWANHEGPFVTVRDRLVA
jgi:hypothetical protein